MASPIGYDVKISFLNDEDEYKRNMVNAIEKETQKREREYAEAIFKPTFPTLMSSFIDELRNPVNVMRLRAHITPKDGLWIVLVHEEGKDPIINQTYRSKDEAESAFCYGLLEFINMLPNKERVARLREFYGKESLVTDKSPKEKPKGRRIILED